MGRPQNTAPRGSAPPPRYPVAVPRGQNPPRRRRPVGAFLLGLSAFVLLTVTAALVGLALVYSSDIIPGGFESLGASLGGGTRGQASDNLARAWERYAVTVDLGRGRVESVRPEDLGITLDITATVRLAYDEGRSSPALQQMLRSHQLALPGTHVDPVWRFDAGRADRTLQNLERQSYIQPQSATLKVNGAKVETTSPSEGLALDVPASGARLSADPWAVVAQGRFQPVLLPVAPPITDTSALAAEVQDWLSAPIAVHMYDAVADEKLDLQISPETIGDWIKVKPKANTPSQLEAILDPPRVESFLAEQSKALGPGRYLETAKAVPILAASMQGKHDVVRLRIYHSERQHTVQAGQTLSSIADQYGIPYPWIQKANSGMGANLGTGQVIKIPSQDVMIPVTPIENKRIVVSLKSQKMWAYEEGKLKWQWPVSTGISSSPTSPGVFQIQTHEKEAYAGNWDLWMPWFMGVYRPVPDVDFMNGFHGFPKRGGAQILWTNDLGRQVTYGCILISTENAKTLFDWAEDGIVVEIRREAQ